MNPSDPKSHSPLPGEELDALEQAISREAKSGAPTEETKHVRVRLGIYSMRGDTGKYVVRLRLPAGILTPDQLDRTAEIAEKFAPPGILHLTTRQGIQIAGVRGPDVRKVLEGLAAGGLTTRKTGGNVVRNTVCCSLAGVSERESFDVTPFALTCDRLLKDDPRFQAMPRKIKIAFEGCLEDHVRTAVSDIGLRGEVRDRRAGFRITIGGGLGAVPALGRLLEEFTPAEILLPTLEAILLVFDHHGNRSNRSQARLKWLVRSRGIEWVRRAILEERERLLQEGPLSFPVSEFPSETSPSRTGPIFSKRLSAADLETFAEWRSFNARAQSQPGFRAVMVRCPLGDLNPRQARALAEAGRRLGKVPLRITIEQNVVLRWVHESRLEEVFEQLSGEGLAGCCAEHVEDVTRCIGAEACLSAITHPAGAARSIGAVLTKEWRSDPQVRSLRIRVSGCPNGCSHHPAADIGLSGMAKVCHGRMAPHYSIRLGGRPDGGNLGNPVIAVPARAAAEAVEAILKSYREGKAREETFGQYVRRIGLPALRARLEKFAQVPPFEQAPEFYRDLGAEKDFSLDAREGECHA